MKPQTIRRVDAWLGKPACFFLTVLRRIASPFRSKRVPVGPPKKILLIKMTEQGATVLSYRAITRAIEIVGREHVYFWVFEENRPILDLMGLIPSENVISVRATGLVQFAKEVLGTLWQIRRLGIDATIDMEFFARASAILAFLTRAERRVGLHRFKAEGPYRGDLLTHRMQWNPYVHTAASYYAMVEATLDDPREAPMLKRPIPPGVDWTPPILNMPDADQQAAREILARESGSTEGPVVLLNPNASDLLPLRRWPTPRFVELAKRILAEDPAAKIGFTGAPDERNAVEALVREINSPRVFSLAGKTTLRELLALYGLCNVLVTNDSGPGHFSSLTNIHTIVLFGPETPALYGPLGKNAHVLYAGLACSPCVNALNHRFSPCKNNVCMQEITVQRALETVMSLVHQPAPPARPALQTAWPPN